MTLQELTSRESGLVVYDDDEAIICNWLGFSGLPKVFVTGLIDWPADIPQVPGEHVADLLELLDGTTVIYNSIDDELPRSGTVYRIDETTLVIAPDGWA